MRRHCTAPHASQALMGEGGLAVICKAGPKLRLYQDASRPYIHFRDSTLDAAHLLGQGHLDVVGLAPISQLALRLL